MHEENENIHILTKFNGNFEIFEKIGRFLKENDKFSNDIGRCYYI